MIVVTTENLPGRRVRDVATHGIAIVVAPVPN